MSFWSLTSADAAAPALLIGSSPETSAEISYGELAAHSDTLAQRLHRDSAKQLCLILCSNSAATLINYLAALRRGDAVMLVQADTNPALLRELIARYQPDWIHQPIAGPLWAGYVDESGLSGDAGWTIQRRAETGQSIPLHADLAVLLSTSGTTGSPKMVKLSYSNIASNARAIVEYLVIDRHERAVTTLPFSYSYGMSVINSHLEAGAALVLTESSLSTRDFWSGFALHQVSSLAGVPYTYQMLRRLDPRRLPLTSLKTLTQAGGRLPPDLTDYFFDLSQELGWRFFVMYGQTEASPRISYVPPHMLASKAGSIGIAIPGQRLSLSEAGELLVEGPNVMMGYADCRADLSRGDEMEGCLATGDLARVDADGYYFLHGRLKRFIKIHGKRISLDDVENVLQAHLRRDVAAVGRDDMLSLYLTDGSDLQAAKAVLADLFHLHPTTFLTLTLPALPRTVSGKTDYASLECR